MVSLSKISIIKLLELIIACILIGLHAHSFNMGNKHTAMLTMGTFAGYLIILVGLFVGTLMGTPVNRRVDLFYSLVGCILFVIVGALNIDYFNNMFDGSFRDTGLAKGSISVIEGALFLLDSFLTFQGEA